MLALSFTTTYNVANLFITTQYNLLDKYEPWQTLPHYCQLVVKVRKQMKGGIVFNMSPKHSWEMNALLRPCDLGEIIKANMRLTVNSLIAPTQTVGRFVRQPCVYVHFMFRN